MCGGLVDHTGLHEEATAWWRHEDADNMWIEVGVAMRHTIIHTTTQ
jgi:hypothetical protein